MLYDGNNIFIIHTLLYMNCVLLTINHQPMKPCMAAMKLGISFSWLISFLRCNKQTLLIAHLHKATFHIMVCLFPKPLILKRTLLASFAVLVFPVLIDTTLPTSLPINLPAHDHSLIKLRHFRSQLQNSWVTWVSYYARCHMTDDSTRGFSSRSWSLFGASH